MEQAVQYGESIATVEIDEGILQADITSGAGIHPVLYHLQTLLLGELSLITETQVRLVEPFDYGDIIDYTEVFGSRDRAADNFDHILMKQHGSIVAPELIWIRSFSLKTRRGT